ncbi:MAG: hypothetical protein QW348_00840 [Ignisphaera sp.]
MFAKAFIIVLLVLLLLTSLPIFSGQVFGQYYDESIKGFVIPKDYRIVMDLEAKPYEHILLLPATSTYVSTSWGWQGSIGWYHMLNGAILSYTFAPYSEYTSWEEVYGMLTRPQLKVVDGVSLTSQVNVEKAYVWGGQGELLYARLLENGSLLLDVVLHKSGWDYADIILPFTRPLNISMYKLLEIDLSISGEENVTLTPWLFIYSDNFAGAHILDTITLPGSVSRVYAVGVSDKPWPDSIYDPNHITGFMLRIYGLQKINNSRLYVKILLRVEVGNRAILSETYLDMLSLLNVKYIIVDRSLNTYNKFWEIVDQILRENFKTIYDGEVLSVYRTPVNTSPIKIVEPSNAKMEILECKSSFIKARITMQEDGGKALMVVPLLYSSSLPNPVKIEVYANGKPLEVEPISYRGLRGYYIDPNGYSNLTVIVSYTEKFKMLYVSILIFNLIPLLLFLLSFILYLRGSPKVEQ